MKKTKLIKWILAGVVLTEVIAFAYQHYVPKKYFSTYELMSNDMYHMAEKGTVASIKTLEVLLNTHPTATERQYRVFTSNSSPTKVEVRVSFDTKDKYLTTEELTAVIKEIEETYANSYRQNKSKIVESSKAFSSGQGLTIDISSLLIIDFFPHFDVVPGKKVITHGIQPFPLRLMLWVSIFIVMFMVDQIIKKRKLFI